jgi:hypothetical protein
VVPPVLPIELTGEEGGVLPDDFEESTVATSYGEDFRLNELKESVMWNRGEDQFEDTLKQANQTVLTVDETVDLDDVLFRHTRTLKEQQRRELQNSNTKGIGTFAPLSCNLPSLPSGAQCMSSPDGVLSTLVNAAGGGMVVVPCGKCYRVSVVV